MFLNGKILQPVSHMNLDEQMREEESKQSKGRVSL